MWSRRDFVDYSLKRRATLVNHVRGLATQDEICDADPYLRLAARYHGEAIERPCPICRKVEMVTLNYAFGDQLGQYSGRLKATHELNEMQNEFGEFRVYVVEVCRSCNWHHLIHSFRLGDGVNRKPPRRQRTIEDEDYLLPSRSGQ
jgi:hypothetical protein